jgi:hypothetical protein
MGLFDIRVNVKALVAGIFCFKLARAWVKNLLMTHDHVTHDQHAHAAHAIFIQPDKETPAT